MKARPQPAADAGDLPEEILELARLLADIAAAEQTADKPTDKEAAADH